MLGYTERSSNNVYVFFEDNEIRELESRTIIGTYFNPKDYSVTCPLEVIVEECLNDLTKIVAEFGEDDFISSFKVLIRRSEYERLLKTKSFEDHKGYCHVFLLDVDNLDPMTNLNYEQLKNWKD